MYTFSVPAKRYLPLTRRSGQLVRPWFPSWPVNLLVVYSPFVEAADRVRKPDGPYTWPCPLKLALVGAEFKAGDGIHVIAHRRIETGRLEIDEYLVDFLEVWVLPSGWIGVLWSVSAATSSTSLDSFPET